MRSHAKAVVAGLTLLASLTLGVALAWATAPTVVTDDASSVSYSTAHASGRVDPTDQDVFGCRFDYVNQGDYQFSLDIGGNGWDFAAQAGCLDSGGNPIDGGNPITAGSGATDVRADLSGLNPDTDYHLRLVADNNDGTTAVEATNTFRTLAVTAPTPRIDPVSSIDDTSAHFSGSVNPNAPGGAPQDPAFDSNWNFDCVPSCPGPRGGTVAADNTDNPVADDATRLQPNTDYTVTLHASSLGGEGTDQASFRTDAVPPTVQTTGASSPSSSVAQLNGNLNPHNSPTSYWFEWGTRDCSANPCTAVPASRDADAGSGGSNQFVSQQVTGLEHGTTYHYRLVADNGVGGPVAGDDVTFTTADPTATCTNTDAPGTGFLPNCRAYELVSPPSKGGADVIAQSHKTFAAADGNGVVFPATGAFAGTLGTSVDVQYLSRRTGRPGTNGWSTHPINPAGGSQVLQVLPIGNAPTFEAAFAEDLTAGIYKAWRPLTEAPNVGGVSNLYRLRDLDERVPDVELLTESASPLAAMPNALRWLFVTAFDGASRDLRHVLYQSPWNLTGDGAFSFSGDLYEFADGVGVRRVGRIPSAPATACDDAAGPTCMDAASAQAGISASLTPGNSMHSAGMISDDGSRIVFNVTAGDMAGALFMREDGVRTFQVNTSEKSTLESPQSAVAWEASRDGSRVFFTTAEGLVDGDDGAEDLYMYDHIAPAGSRLTRLSVNATGDACEAAGVVGASSDGHVVYFVCTGQLVPSVPGSLMGLFRWENGTFAYLGRFDSFSLARPNTARTPWSFPTETKTSRVTPDGRFVLFMAIRDDGFSGVGGFAGYEHEGIRQLYLYSAQTRRLVCISCNPRSRAATGDALTDFKMPVSATAHTQHLSHALSDDGRRVFFSTPEALVAEDSNGRWDAYEYDVPSGTLHLISSGKDPADSFFLEASANGDDVFFATRERLVGWDIDESYDLYDARVGGGFPEPVPGTVPCAGEACRAPASPRPNDLDSTSSNFRGSGNAKVNRRVRCTRSQRKVRRNGRARCVRKKNSKRANTHRRASR